MKGKRLLLRIVKVLAGCVAGLAVLLVAAFFALNSPAMQNRLMRHATEIISEKLQTEVTIDSIAVDLPSASFRLIGLNILDQQKQELLQVHRLDAKVELWPLLKRQIVTRRLDVEQVDAVVKTATDSTPANYQFLLDAFKKKDTAEKPAADKAGKRFALDIRQVRLKDIRVSCDKNRFELGTGTYAKKNHGRHELTLGRLHIVTDNGLPRKNTGKPHRGFFDKGHLDMWADASIFADSIGENALVFTLENCQVTDSVAGLHISTLHAKVHANKQRATLTKVELRHKNTHLTTDSIGIILPSKKEGRTLVLQSAVVKGRTIPQDIARPFAPALKNFTIPIDLQTRVEVADGIIRLHDIHLSTADKQLTISAEGTLANLKKEQKKDLNLHFKVREMEAKGDVAERIVNQFAVKKLMMRELRKLGTLRYTGTFSVLWKRQVFQGLLQTNAGGISLNFTLDGLNKYVYGTARTRGFHLGKVLDLPKLGDITCSAQFKVDISKQRTARMRTVKGGKLPIGTLSAQVEDCSYEGLHLRRLSADIASNGAEASGNVRKSGHFGDVYTSFTYIDTDQQHKVKIDSPGLKLRKADKQTDKEKKEKKEKKNRKKKQQEGEN